MEDLRETFKPNSHRYIGDAAPSKNEKKLEKVTDSAQIRKKSPGKKFLESFLADDVPSIKNYILYDVILPAFKNTIVDAVTNSIQMIFWGNGRRPTNANRIGSRTYINYGGTSVNVSQKPPFSLAGDRYDCGDIILASRGEAEEALSQLVVLTQDYGSASVADLYYMVGIQSNHTDQKWGWKDLSSAYVCRVRDGYALKLPKVIAIS